MTLATFLAIGFLAAAALFVSAVVLAVRGLFDSPGVKATVIVPGKGE